MSFYVKSSITGTFGVNLYKSDNTGRIINATYSISSANTWEQKVITFDGDTSGGGIDNDNGEGLRVVWHLASGSDYDSVNSTSWANYSTTNWAGGHAQDGVITTTNATWQLTGVQLEVGDFPSGTPFEHRSFGEELELCKRYFERIFRGGNAPQGTERTALGAGVWYQDSQVLSNVAFSTKRAAPTVTQSETGALGCYGSGFFRTSTDSTPFDSITPNSMRLNINSFNSNGTQGDGTYVQLVTNNSSNISIDAEL